MSSIVAGAAGIEVGRLDTLAVGGIEAGYSVQINEKKAKKVF